MLKECLFPRLPLITGWLGLLLLSLSGLVNAAEAARPVTTRLPTPLVIAIERDYSPLTLMTPTQQPTGLLVEIWQLWSEKTGHPIQFHPVDSFAASLEALRKGDADMVADMVADMQAGSFASEADRQWLAFSQTFYGVGMGVFYPSDHPNFLGLEALSGKTVAVNRQSHQAAYLQRYYPEITVLAVENPRAGLQAVLNDQAQAMLGDVPVLAAVIAAAGMSDDLSEYPDNYVINHLSAAVLREHADWLPLINEGLNRLLPRELTHIEARWLPNPERGYFQLATQALSLTRDEKRWLEQHSQIRLGMHPHWPPFAMKKANTDSYLGMVSDYLRLLEERLGITLTPVFQTDWATLLNQVAQHQLDAVPIGSDATQPAKPLRLSDPYLSFPTVIVTAQDAPFVGGLRDLYSLRVAVTDNLTTQVQLIREHPQVQWVLFSKAEEAMQAVSTGLVKAYIDNLAVVHYLMQDETIKSVKIAAPTDYAPIKLHFAIRDDWPELVTILNKALATITPEEQLKIQQKWLSTARTQQFQSHWLWLLAWLVLITALVVWRIRHSRQQQQLPVLIDTEMAQALQTAQAELQRYKTTSNLADRANQAFLAYISPALCEPLLAVQNQTALLKQKLKDPEVIEHLYCIHNNSASLLKLIQDILDLSRIEAGQFTSKPQSVELYRLVHSIWQIFSQDIKNKGLKLSIDIAMGVPHQVILDEARLRQILLTLVGNAVKFTDTGQIRLVVERLAASRLTPTTAEAAHLDLKFSVQDTGIGIPKTQQSQIFEAFTPRHAHTAPALGGGGLGLALIRRLVDSLGGELRLHSQAGQGSTFEVILRHVEIASPSCNLPSPIHQTHAPARQAEREYQSPAEAPNVRQDHSLTAHGAGEYSGICQ